MCKATAIVMIVVSMVLAMSTPAFAHDPIFVTNDQKTPDTGPFMPDGSISWALYGTVQEAGDTRGFEFDLREGDEVFVSLLIPNLEPEVDLTDDELPIIELEAPDGTLTTIVPEIRDVFDEPFSRTSYVTLAEHREPAQAGRYRGTLIGGAAARFSVAIGETEIFFTETERSGDRPGSFAEITAPLTAWYTTLANGEVDPNSVADGEGEIDLDMIEDAMESGEAQAPEGSITGESDDADAMVDEEEAAEDEAMTDEEPAADVPEEDPVEQSAPVDNQDDTTETASAPLDDGGSGATWVAPVAIGAVAVLGAGAYFARRGRDDES